MLLCTDSKCVEVRNSGAIGTPQPYAALTDLCWIVIAVQGQVG